MVDTGAGTVARFDPQSLALAHPIKVPGGIASEAVTAAGAAYVGSDNGTVTVVANGKATTARVGTTGQPVDVTVVGNQPAAVDTANGQLRVLDTNGSGRGPAISLPGRTGSTVELSPSLQAGPLWLIRGTQLLEVNLATGETVQTTPPRGDSFGPPVTNAGDAYLPDNTTNRVLVYDPLWPSSTRSPFPPASRARPTSKFW